MKKSGFTLIEMMIVVALIATLMTIVFRLSAVGEGETRRMTTIMRLERLENCLSGYYAAYGNYPPVRPHNTRDIYRKVDEYDIQLPDTGDISWNWDTKRFEREVSDDPSAWYGSQQDERNAWQQIRAACASQPMGAEYPFAGTKGGADIKEYVIQYSRALKEFLPYASDSKDSSHYKNINTGFDALGDGTRGALDKDAVSWRDIQLFKFGLMSFLLPRYQLMLGLDDAYFGENNEIVYKQWGTNNANSPHKAFEGGSYSWKELNQSVRNVKDSTTVDVRENAALQNIAVESVPLRWMPNLENICFVKKGTAVFGGIELSESSIGMFVLPHREGERLPIFDIFAAGDSRNLYVLDGVTVRDGWGQEFYYYSPPPHQSYQLWSSGRNLRTFPPWIPREKLSSAALERVMCWIRDDIKGMSN